MGPRDVAAPPVVKRKSKFSEYMKQAGVDYSKLRRNEREQARSAWISSLPDQTIVEAGGPEELHAAVKRKYPEEVLYDQISDAARNAQQPEQFGGPKPYVPDLRVPAVFRDVVQYDKLSPHERDEAAYVFKTKINPGVDLDDSKKAVKFTEWLKNRKRKYDLDSGEFDRLVTRTEWIESLPIDIIDEAGGEAALHKAINEKYGFGDTLSSYDKIGRAGSAQRAETRDEVIRRIKDRREYSPFIRGFLSAPSGTGQIFKMEDERTMDASRFAMEQAEVGDKTGFKVGSFAGPIIKDTPVMIGGGLAGGPAGMGAVVGLQGAGRELGRQAAQGEDADYLRAAGMGAAEGAGALVSGKLGDLARAKYLLNATDDAAFAAGKQAIADGAKVKLGHRLAATAAEGFVDSAADTIVTNTARTGINVATGEDPDRDVDYLRDFITNAAGFTGISLAKNLPLAALKAGDRGAGTAMRTFRSLIEVPHNLKKAMDEDFEIRKGAGKAKTAEAAEKQRVQGLSAEELAKQGYVRADQVRSEALKKMRKPIAQEGDITIKPTPADVLPLDESFAPYASKRVMVETTDAAGNRVKMMKDLRLETPGKEMQDAGVADAVYNRLRQEKEAAKTASWITYMMKKPTSVIRHLPDAVRKGWRSQPELRRFSDALMTALVHRNHYVASKVMSWFPREKGNIYNNEAAIEFLAASDRQASTSAIIQEKQMRVLKDVHEVEKLAKKQSVRTATGQDYNAWDLGIQVATMLRKLNISKKLYGDYEHAKMGKMTGRDMLIALNTWKADPEIQKIWPAVDSVLKLVDKNAREIRDLYKANGMIDDARAYDMEQLGIWMPLDYKNTRPGEVRTLAELDEANFGTVGYKPNTDIERISYANDLVPDMDYKNTILNAWYDAVEKVNRNAALAALDNVVNEVSAMVKRADLDTGKIGKVKAYMETPDAKAAAEAGKMQAAASANAKVRELKEFQAELKARNDKAAELRQKISDAAPDDPMRQVMQKELARTESSIRGGVRKLRDMKKEVGKARTDVSAAVEAERLVTKNDIDTLRKIVAADEARISGVAREKKVAAFSRTKDEKRGLTQKMTYTRANGEQSHFYVTKKFKTEFEAAEPKTLNTVMKWLSTISGTRILRATATAQNLAFTATNLARDVMYNAFVDSSGIVSEKTGIGFGSLIRPITRMLLRDVRDTDFGKVDTSVTGLMRMWLMEPKKFREISDSFVAHGGARFGSIRDETHGNYLGDSHNLERGLWEKMEYLIEGSERVTRMSMYLKAQEKLPKIFKKKLDSGEWTQMDYERAITKRDEMAAWSAARVIDFTQGGNVTRLMSSMVPYLNASVQGTRGLIRAWIENPDLMIWKMADFGALVAGLAAYNIMTGEDDKFTAQQKRSGLYMIIPGAGYWDDTTDTYIPRAITIPIPQELQVYKSFIEAVANGASRGLSESDTDSVLESVQSTIPGGFPPVVNAYLAMTGYDTFMKRELGDAGYDTPGLRYDKNTHVFYRALGEVAPDLVDPRKIQRAVNAYIAESNFAYRGLHAMVDMAGREAFPHNIDAAGNLVKSLGVGRFVMAGRPDIVAKTQLEREKENKSRLFDMARSRARAMVTKVVNGEMSRMDAAEALRQEFDDRKERAKAVEMFISGLNRAKRSEREIQDVIDKDFDGDEYSENSEE